MFKVSTLSGNVWQQYGDVRNDQYAFACSEKYFIVKQPLIKMIWQSI